MSLTPDMLTAWQLQPIVKQQEEEITRLRAEVEQAQMREACAADLAREWEHHCKTAEAEVEKLKAAVAYLQGIVNDDGEKEKRLRAEINAHNHAEVKLIVEIDELRAEVDQAQMREACAADLAREWEHHCKTAEAEVEKLKAEIKRAIRQHEEGNKGLAHRTLCEAVYGEQA